MLFLDLFKTNFLFTNKQELNNLISKYSRKISFYSVATINCSIFPQVSSSYSLRLRDDYIILKPPAVKSIATLGDRASAATAPKLWTHFFRLIHFLLVTDL